VTQADLTPGRAVALADAVWRVVAPNAGLMTGPGTNTYVLGTGECAVLDPGPNDPVHLEAVIAAAQGSIRWVIVTHTHRDHSPLAAELARCTGARLIGLPPPRDGRQDESFASGWLPGEGERLALGGMELIAIRTPGHASNCVCYLLQAERLLFTGDHVLEGISPVILPPDGDMGAYLDSLDKLFAYDFERIAPGHGATMQAGKRVIEALRRHRLAREAKVVRALGTLGPSSIEELTAVVYDDVPADRHQWARLTLEAHLLKLARDARATQAEGRWRLSAA
jgi:glyoxylase-like metal-dependent hydrolase (beta-lactamase superfamily II)